jgi:hypothetical protein
MNQNDLSTDKLLADALNHLEAAIELLDQAGAPGHVAAHADLAASQLQALVATRGAIRRMNENGEEFGTVQPS